MTHSITPLCIAAALVAPALGCGGAPQAPQRPAGYYVVQYRAVPVVAPIAQPAECCEYGPRPKLLTRCLVFRGLDHYRGGQRAHALQLLRQGELLYRSGRRRWLPRFVVFQMQHALYELERSSHNPTILPRALPRVGAAVSTSTEPEVETIQ